MKGNEMPHLIFVHGTGVRRVSLERTSDLLRQKFPDQERVRLHVPPWAEFSGAIARKPDEKAAAGASSEQSATEAAWRLILLDALIEHRTKLLAVPNPVDSGEEIGGEMLRYIDTVCANPANFGELLEILKWDVTTDLVARACRRLLETQVVLECSSHCETQMDFATLFSRSAIAMVMREIRGADWLYSAAELEDASSHLAVLLCPVRGGFFSAIAKAIATPWFRSSRQKYMEQFSGPVGDILVYQAKGSRCRDYLARYIAELGPDSRVILMAHSLGGVLSVDLLLSEPLPTVAALFTMGSQAAFFYEINALASADFAEGGVKPRHTLPPWINFYDENDFLSFRAEKMFPGLVEDRLVPSGLNFPESHSGYFNSDIVWEAIESTVKNS